MEEKTVGPLFIPAIELLDGQGQQTIEQPGQQGEFNPYFEFPLYVFDHLAVPIAYALGFLNMRRFFRAEHVKKTRQPHVCERCGREIPKGSEAYAVTFTTGSWEWSKKFTVYYHADCYRAAVEEVTEKLAATVRWVLLENAEERQDIFGRRKGCMYPYEEC